MPRPLAVTSLLAMPSQSLANDFGQAQDVRIIDRHVILSLRISSNGFPSFPSRSRGKTFSNPLLLRQDRQMLL